jgi:hypothetical protein
MVDIGFQLLPDKYPYLWQALQEAFVQPEIPMRCREIIGKGISLTVTRDAHTPKISP